MASSAWLVTTTSARPRGAAGAIAGLLVAARLSGVDESGLAAHASAITSLARLQEPGESFAASASLEISLSGGTAAVELDLSGTVDLVAERKRLAKDLAAAEKELAQCEAKLGNAKFTDKAPADVVDKIRARKDVAFAEIERITARMAALPSA